MTTTTTETKRRKRLSANARQYIGQTISVKWGTSRGRDSYGYTTCSLYNPDGRRAAGCNGGGYDMRGTVVGHWIASAFCSDLLKLKPDDMPEHDHWEPERARVCAGKCGEAHHDALMAAIINEQPHPDETKLPDDCFECPTCHGPTHASRDGKRVEDGRYFYGLTFHNPNFDPGKAVVGRDCTDRTFNHDGANEGKTVAEAEAAGQSIGLERYQAIYRASSKVPTRLHRVPSIDGACGFESVLRIFRGIGLDLRKVADTSKLDVYEIVRASR